jgi:hypothetical protein
MEIMMRPVPSDRRAPFAAVLLTLALSLWLSAGTNAAAQAPAESFNARIIDNTVQVRSGAGRAYYEVGTLQRGERVVVEDELFGWYKVQTPEGVFCFVDRKNVDAKGDGSRGVVNTDGTPVNAAHASKGPADSYRNLLKLNAGDTVEIVDTVSNAYKIKPPAGAYVYLPPGSLEAVADEPEPQPTPEPTPEPAPTPDNRSTNNADPEPTPATPEPAPQPVTPPAPSAPPTNNETATQTDTDPGPTDRPAPIELPPAPPVAPVTPPPTAADSDPAVTDVEFDTPAPDADRPSVDQALAAVAPASAERLLNDPEVAVTAPDVQVATPASHPLLRAVEVAMLPYFTLPVDQQPIAKMVRGYADASQIDGLSDNDLTIIRARLTELERNRALAEAIAEAEGALQGTTANAESENAGPDQTTSNDAESDGESTADAEAPAPPAEGESAEDADASADASPPASTSDAPESPAPPAYRTEYDAVGILTVSTVHTGGNQPKLLRLLDPTGRRTVAYLEPLDNEEMTVRMIGRLVGIRGEAIFDPTTRLNLIQPTQIDILSPR